MRDEKPDRFDGLAGFAELRAEARPGECLFCGEPVKATVTKPHVTCGSAECKRVYFRLHQRLSRQRKRAALSGPKVAVCNTRPSTVISDPAGA